MRLTGPAPINIDPVQVAISCRGWQTAARPSRAGPDGADNPGGPSNDNAKHTTGRHGNSPGGRSVCA